jgi:hypothetical protein
MTHFEYLAVSAAILISVAVARIVSGLPHALEVSRRFSLHWGWMSLWLWGITVSWWNIWIYRDLEWTFVRFLLFVALNGPLLFISYTLVPDNPEQVTSWKEHFYATRRRFFGATIVYFAILLIQLAVLQSVSIFDAARWAIVFLLGLAIVGFFNAKPIVQYAVLALNVVMQLAFFVQLVRSPLASVT